MIAVTVTMKAMTMILKERVERSTMIIYSLSPRVVHRLPKAMMILTKRWAEKVKSLRYVVLLSVSTFMRVYFL